MVMSLSDQCNHTLQLTDQKGQPCGTWIKQGNKVVCGKCGRLYGYLQKEKKPKSQTKIRKTKP